MSVPAPTRTFLVGLGIDVAVAIATALLAWLPAADLSQRAAWIILGTTVAKTLISTVASYVLRLKLQPATEVDGAFRITDAQLPTDLGEQVRRAVRDGVRDGAKQGDRRRG